MEEHRTPVPDQLTGSAPPPYRPRERYFFPRRGGPESPSRATTISSPGLTSRAASVVSASKEKETRGSPRHTRVIEPFASPLSLASVSHIPCVRDELTLFASLSA